MAARQSDGEQYGHNENKGFWSIDFGNSPVIGTAIHDGHFIRPEMAGLMALSAEQRLREEDPFTGEMISGLTNRLVVHHSRFEIDLNRAADQAIYLTPEQSWGLRSGKRSRQRKRCGNHSISTPIIMQCWRRLFLRWSGGMAPLWCWTCIAIIIADRALLRLQRRRRKRPISISVHFPWIAAAGAMWSAPSVIISRQRPLVADALMFARMWRFRAKGADPLHP